MAEHKKATMQDIAKKSGFSKAAVSFAFNQPERISVETYEKIMEAARELDYLPDPMAQSLSKGRLNIIGLILPQGIESVFDNPYTLEVMKGVGRVAENNGSFLTLIPPVNSSIADAMKSAMVDGMITFGCTLDPDIREVIRKRRIPVVSIDGNTAEGIVSVQTDDEKAACEQIERAIGLGHRDFAIVGLGKSAYAGAYRNEDDTGAKRMKGYRRALMSHGLDIDDQLILTADPTTLEAGEKAGKEIFTSGKKVSCIVTMADIIGYGILKAARDMDIDIPRDCSLIGFDGIVHDFGSGPELSTIVQPGLEKGKEAARLLFSAISGESPSGDFRHYIDYRFKKGNTLQKKEN